MNSPQAAVHEVKTYWESVGDRPVEFVNQFLLSTAATTPVNPQEDGVTLIAGRVLMPLIFEPSDIDSFVKSGQRVPVSIRGVFFMTNAAALELYKTLGRHLGITDGSQK